VERGRNHTGSARIRPEVVASAIGAKRHAMHGVDLTEGQRRAVSGITGSGHGVDLVIGVAGAGKTTMLDVVRMAYEAEGYTVIGTATSGQAARTLGSDANMASSTLASLLWRLDHNQARLDAGTVVILDEAGMTDDPDLLRILTAAENAGAKVVMVGDDRQLGAVGPGGGLRALAARHRPGVWVLDENIRQADPTERTALEQLRAGDAARAVDWMAANGRIAVGVDRPDTVNAMVAAWATDLDAGRDSMMLAWRRTNVDALNRAARQLYDELPGRRPHRHPGPRRQRPDRHLRTRHRHRRRPRRPVTRRPHGRRPAPALHR
jgi:ATP-dependent exoDNAse (exonuclease V) alpha subunit